MKIVHAVNTAPYKLIYPDGPPSPLADAGGGGVSGGPAFEIAFNYNLGLRQKVSVPIIMGCGITSLAGVRRYFNEAGADAVSLCTVCRRNPGKAIRIIRELAT